MKSALARPGICGFKPGLRQAARKDSAPAQWYRARTADARGATRKRMIVALARKLLVALWKLVTTGEVPRGVLLRPEIPAAA